jgi:hypothetical protein
MSPSTSGVLGTPVAIVGAGPVGLSLALGLARHGVRSVLVEREESTSQRSKAPGIHVRTREVFRQWGVEEPFLEAGVLKRSLTLHSPVAGHRPLASVDFSELDVEAHLPGVLVIRRMNLRRTAMLDLAYPASPLLDAREPAAGVRLPNPVLHSPDGIHVRLYELLPNAPVLLEVTAARDVTIELPVDHVSPDGAGGFLDPSELLRRLLGGKDGWILVRPDTHIAWARHRLEGLGAAVRHALGS